MCYYIWMVWCWGMCTVGCEGARILYTTHSSMHSISKTSGLFLMHFPLGRVVYASGPLLTGGPVPRTWRPDPLQVLWHISASYAFFSLGPVVAADPCHLPSNTADKLPSSANTTHWSITQQSCESVSIPVRAGWISTTLEQANEESDQNILTSWSSPLPLTFYTPTTKISRWISLFLNKSL